MQIATRAKFKLAEITHVSWNPNTRRVKFSTEYDPSLPEDQRFSNATPSGEITMIVDNPVAVARLEIGKSYYVDFTPISE